MGDVADLVREDAGKFAAVEDLEQPVGDADRAVLGAAHGKGVRQPARDAIKRRGARQAGAARELGAADAAPSGHGTVVTAWQRSARRSPAEAWRIALQLLGTLRGTARIELLVPPPSRWGAARGRAGRPAGGGDDRALRVIRGLLAKAESTEFAEEAEALTAKAQELMTRHAVDAAVLQGEVPPGDVDTRRVHVADPYVRAKVQLLGAVAEANDVRLVWYQGLGIATVVGGRADLDAVELLFTSLLLQVAQGLAAAERYAGPRSSPRTFRRAFLLGYAHRIGERLQDARHRRGRCRAGGGPAAGAAVAAGGRRRRGGRAVPEAPHQPQPRLGRRGRLDRRPERGRAGRRRAAPLAADLIRGRPEVFPRERRGPGAAGNSPGSVPARPRIGLSIFGRGER